jgi:tetratricopeptide (TPR) repeat protein
MTEDPAPVWLRDRRLVAALFFLAALVVYLPAMSWGTFHYDDFHSIVQNPGVRDLANVPRYFVDPQLWSAEPGNLMYRPVLLVTCAVDYAFWKYDASGWLLTNALLHAVAAVLVYRLALRLGLGPVAAAFAGAVFVLHPAISEVQNYVSSRSESLTAVLLLAALHFHMTGGVAGIAGAIACLVAALLTKENAATFCAVVACWELLVPRREIGRRIARAAAFGALYLLPAALFLFVVRPRMLHADAIPVAFANAPDGADPLVGGGRTYLGNMLTQSRVDLLYLQLLVKPVGLAIDHDIAVTASAGTVAAAIAIHAAILAAAVRSALRGHRLFPLCVGWWWALHLVTFVQPLNVVANEHRLYLPMIAVAPLAGAALARVADVLAARTGSAAKGLAVAAAPLVCYVPLTVQRSYEWRSDEALWTSCVARSPLSARAHMHLGAVFHERANGETDRAERIRLFDAALAEYAISERLHPNWADLQLDIGNARFTRGQATHDRADFEKALAAYVKFGEIVGVTAARPRMLQAAAYAELGEVDRAIAMVEKVKSEDPDSVTRLYDDQLARLYRKTGDKKRAAELMRHVIDVDAKDRVVDGLLDLGWWCFEDGDLQESSKLLGRAWDIAQETHDMRPPLYIARFHFLARLPGGEKFLHDAEKLGWKAPPQEALWATGRGGTPGVFTGTAGSAPPR